MATIIRGDDDFDSGKNGRVVNVQHYEDSTHTQVSVAAYTDVWTITYTPVSDDSTLIITSALNLRGARNGGADARFALRFTIDGTAYSAQKTMGHYDYGGGGSWYRMLTPLTAKYDNTSTTAKSIKVQIGHVSGTGAFLNSTDGDEELSTITITEVVD